MKTLICKRSASKVIELSEQCADPREGCTRMLSSMKAVENYLKKVIVRNRLDKMIKIGVGTEEVEATAKRVLGINNTDKKGIRKEVKRIMVIRKKQVEKEMNTLKYEWHKSTDETRKILQSNKLIREYWQIENEYRNVVWKEALTASCEKLRSASKKRRRGTESKRGDETWFKMCDKELERSEEIDQSENFKVYGDVELTNAEKACLNLGPKFMMTPILNSEDYEVEVELECVKARMELKNREEVAEEDGTVLEEDLRKYKEEYRERRKIFDPKKRVLDMSKMSVTDTKYNIRSYPIKEANPRDEIYIQGRRLDMLSTFEQFKHRKCKKKGEKRVTNMTAEQEEGRKSLQKRMKEGRIVVTMTDKSGKFAVVDSEMYREAVKVHLQDVEITWKEVSNKEILLSRHAVQLTKAFKMGTKHGKEGQVDRISQAFTSKGGRPGPLYVLVKDHKKTGEGESMPPTRPVCNARGGPGARLSNLLSTVLNKVTDAANPKTECISTEDALRTILDTNRNIQEQCKRDPKYKDVIKEMVVMSLDVKSLYPSLRVKEVSKIVAEYMEEVLTSGKLEITNVDWHEVGKYLAITMPRKEQIRVGIRDAIPKRTVGENARGQKPGAAYWDSDMIERKQNEETIKTGKWIEAAQPSSSQEKKMLSMMIATAVEVSMTNHLYRFDGKVYHQSDGGPIGDELSQAAARMTMAWYDRKLIDKCQKLSIALPYYTRYVDDINNGVIPHPDGTRYVDGELKIKDECIEIDRGKPKDQVAATLVKTVANSITEMLSFEEDVSSKHPDKRLPTLDLKLWTTTTEAQPMKIRHTFYKKPMASKTTLKENTAYPKAQTRAVMVQEVLRRLRNCSPESSWEERGEHLTEFARSLKASGHSEEFRKEVFRKAIRKFKRELQKHQSGKRDMYRPREQRVKEREESGGKSTNDSWFKDMKTTGGEKVTSVFKVPFTGGKLEREVQETLKRWDKPEGIRMKVQEGGGRKLKDVLTKQDPFPRKSCEREQCPIGKECQERCYQDHVNYEMECNECEEGRKADSSRKKYVYYGESSRGCFIRNEGHVQAYKKRDGKEEGFMWNHAKEVHGEKKDIKFKMKRNTVDKDPMRRVLRESVKINRAKKEGVVLLMNSKNDYFGLKVVRPKFGVD